MKRLINIFGESGFLFLSTLVVNIGNYGLNLLLGRFLGPEEFAAANIIATLVLVLSFIALGVQLATTKFISEYNAEGNQLRQEAFLGWMKRAALIFSVTISFILVMASSAIMSFLNFKTATPLVILFVAIPLYIDLCVSRGYFQGKSQFKKLAFTYLVEMITRVVFTTVLIYICFSYNQTWDIEAIALGFIASFAAAAYFGRLPSASLFKENTFAQSKQLYYFLGIVAMYEFSQIIINNSDVLLVKHFFENKEAGLYASLALIGRVVFFATWSIVTVLFPKIIEKEKKGEPHIQYFWGSLAIVSLFGSSVIAGCYLMDNLVMRIMFGEAYLSTAPLLWQYATATTLFSCANVFVYYHMSLENYIPVAISLFIGLLQVIGIFFFHNSMLEIIHVQIAVMGIMLAAMIIYQQVYSIRKRKREQQFSRSLILNQDIS